MDFNFQNLLDQARKIDSGTSALFQKLLDVNSIGSGTNAHVRLDELEASIIKNEDALDTLHGSLAQKLVEIKKYNSEKEESLKKISDEVMKIEEIGRNAGFIIPVDELNMIAMDDISPARSPAKMVALETPLSSRSNTSRGPFLS